MTVYLLRPEGTFLHGTVFCVKIRASVIGRTQKNEQDSRVILVVRMRRNETYPLSSTDLDNILQPPRNFAPPRNHLCNINFGDDRLGV